MKQFFLMVFVYGFWAFVFGSIGWLFFSYRGWNKDQIRKQQNFKRGKK